MEECAKVILDLDLSSRDVLNVSMAYGELDCSLSISRGRGQTTPAAPLPCASLCLGLSLLSQSSDKTSNTSFA